MHRSGMISIWFFIGVLLLIYGIVILGAGIYGLPPAGSVVFGRLHAGIWWGVHVDRLGAFYSIGFRRGKKATE